MTAIGVEVTPLTAPFWEGLRDGVLRFQRCRACAIPRLPPSSECPVCLAAESEWEGAAGGGRLVSWVVFRRAFHPSFAERIPYEVAVVELDEGPRLITNLVGLRGVEPCIDQRVQLRIEREGDLWVPRFALAAPAATPWTVG
jgi:uncharacterized OB-fold protein